MPHFNPSSHVLGPRAAGRGARTADATLPSLAPGTPDAPQGSCGAPPVLPLKATPQFRSAPQLDQRMSWKGTDTCTMGRLISMAETQRTLRSPAFVERAWRTVAMVASLLAALLLSLAVENSSRVMEMSCTSYSAPPHRAPPYSHETLLCVAAAVLAAVSLLWTRTLPSLLVTVFLGRAYLQLYLPSIMLLLGGGELDWNHVPTVLSLYAHNYHVRGVLTKRARLPSAAGVLLESALFFAWAVLQPLSHGHPLVPVVRHALLFALHLTLLTFVENTAELLIVTLYHSRNFWSAMEGFGLVGPAPKKLKLSGRVPSLGFAKALFVLRVMGTGALLWPLLEEKAGGWGTTSATLLVSLVLMDLWVLLDRELWAMGRNVEYTEHLTLYLLTGNHRLRKPRAETIANYSWHQKVGLVVQEGFWAWGNLRKKLKR